MNKVVCSIAMSLDGFVAGPNLTFEHPFGDMPTYALHRWMLEEPEKHQAEVDSLAAGGALIMGSNMYGPKDRRETSDWKGWWGDEPPYHAPVFILTHKQRDPIPMQGGTTFYFVSDGIEAALSRAKEAAGDKFITIVGGASTVNQYLAAGLVDELWLHIAPFTLTFDKGPRLFEGIPNIELEPIEIGGSNLVTHIRYRVIKK